MLLAEMDALSTLGKEDFCRVWCASTEQVCRQSQKQGLTALGPREHTASRKRDPPPASLGPGRATAAPAGPVLGERSGGRAESSSAGQTPTLERLRRVTMIHRLPLGFYRCSSSFQPGQDRCKPSPDVVWTHLPASTLAWFSWQV